MVAFELLFKSYDAIPLGVVSSYAAMMELGLEASNTVYEQAVLIVLPIVSLLFLINLGIGFITKSAPAEFVFVWFPNDNFGDILCTLFFRRCNSIRI